jgi:DNA-binding MarR family transcriptional regulator
MHTRDTIVPTTDARALRRAIKALVGRFSLSARADVSCCGMTVAQAACLEALAAAGPLRLGDLGCRLGIAPSTVSRNLERLESRGLVIRGADADDARAARVRLTEEGKGAAREIERQSECFAVSILERLAPDRRRAVLDSIVELSAAVRQATESCCPGAFDHLLDPTEGRKPTKQRSRT